MDFLDNFSDIQRENSRFSSKRSFLTTVETSQRDPDKCPYPRIQCIVIRHRGYVETVHDIVHPDAESTGGRHWENAHTKGSPFLSSPELQMPAVIDKEK